MNKIKYFFSILFLLAVLVSCKKDTYDDISLVDSGTTPANLSALFDITQDNSGMVTITPNGENGATYDVYYGDGTTAPGKVMAGKSIQHKYAEGVFSVRIVSHGITGKTAEITKQVTVSFRQPENLEVTAVVDGGNNFKVNVTATAIYETVFKVYFGDVANEVPVAFLEGETISHTYATTGDYTIKVVALSGGAATTEFTKIITIVDPILLPLTFESATINYAFIDFAGGNVSIITNPQSNGINTSAKVAKMVKNPGEVYGGSVITLGAPIDFSFNKYFRMKVFSPRVGAKVLLKVENLTNGAISFEKEVATTVANTWEDLAFDYSGIDVTKSYQKIVLIFDLGTVGDGSGNFTYLFDDIRQTSSIPVTQVGLPLTFESSTLNYVFTDFGGGNVTIINNSQVSGINTSSKVAKMIKFTDQVYGGSYITLDNPIDFSVKKTMKMKVFSPRVGAKVLLKVENLTNGAISFEKEVLTTTANVWEELTFNYSAIDATKSYQKVVIIFDNGTMGDGSANFTYLFDDITLN